MGTIDRRLGALEDSFGDELRALEPPDQGESARRLFREAFARLSIVEMNVMEELLEAYRSRPGTSPADVWRELTEAQRTMENEWRKAVTAVATLRPEQREFLKRDVVLAVANAPFYASSRW